MMLDHGIMAGEQHRRAAPYGCLHTCNGVDDAQPANRERHHAAAHALAAGIAIGGVAWDEGTGESTQACDGCASHRDFPMLVAHLRIGRKQRWMSQKHGRARGSGCNARMADDAGRVAGLRPASSSDGPCAPAFSSLQHHTPFSPLSFSSSSRSCVQLKEPHDVKEWRVALKSTWQLEAAAAAGSRSQALAAAASCMARLIVSHLHQE